MRDVEWASNNCSLTFTSIGIWPENADGTDVNYCDRSNDQQLMVTGDDCGKVKLYSYPVIHTKVCVLSMIRSDLIYYSYASLFGFISVLLFLGS